MVKSPLDFNMISEENMRIRLTVILAALFLTTNSAAAAPFKPLERPMTGTFKVKSSWIDRGSKKKIGVIRLSDFRPPASGIAPWKI